VSSAGDLKSDRKKAGGKIGGSETKWKINPKAQTKSHTEKGRSNSVWVGGMQLTICKGGALYLAFRQSVGVISSFNRGSIYLIAQVGFPEKVGDRRKECKDGGKRNKKTSSIVTKRR